MKSTRQIARGLKRKGHKVGIVSKLLGWFGVVSEAKHLERTTECEYTEGAAWMGEGMPGALLLEVKTGVREYAWVVVPAKAAQAAIDSGRLQRKAYITFQESRQRYFDSTGVKFIARHALFNGGHEELCPRLQEAPVTATAPYSTTYED
jgi:hypothetical protein